MPMDQSLKVHILQSCTTVTFCLLEKLWSPFHFVVQKMQMGVIFVLYTGFREAL